MIMFFELQLSLYFDIRSKFPILCLDATGSICPDDPLSGKRIFYYGLVPMNAVGETAKVPVAEFLSSTQSGSSINYFLEFWKSHLLKSHATCRMPRAFLIDCCFAELLAIMKLSSITVERYLSVTHMKYKACKNEVVSVPSLPSMVFFCLNHLVKDLSRLLTKKMSSLDKTTKRWMIRCFGLLQAGVSKKEVFGYWRRMVVVYESAYATEHVSSAIDDLTKSWEHLRETSLSEKEDADMKNISDNEDDVGDDHHVSIPHEGKRYKDFSPFAWDFHEIRVKIVNRINSVPTEGLEKNMYYFPKYLNILLETAQFFPLFPLWSAIFIKGRFPDCKTGRLSAAGMESSIKTTKISLLENKRHRPADVIRLLEKPTYGKTVKAYNENSQKLAKRLVKKSINILNREIGSCEAVWKPKRRYSRPLHFPICKEGNGEPPLKKRNVSFLFQSESSNQSAAVNTSSLAVMQSERSQSPVPIQNSSVTVIQ